MATKDANTIVKPVSLKVPQSVPPKKEEPHYSASSGLSELSSSSTMNGNSSPETEMIINGGVSPNREITMNGGIEAMEPVPFAMPVSVMEQE